MSENLYEDFDKLGDTSDIDNRILARTGQDDLVERMHDETNRQAARKAPWMNDVKEHWFLYGLLIISFLLTETLAVYLGMAPKLMTNEAGEQYIHFHNDFGHLATTFVYMLVFPFVTEIAFDSARKKFNRRETGNSTQAIVMGLAVAVSVVSWVGTGVAGAYVIFATLGSLGFMEVPETVQTWLVWIIPLLVTFFALMHWLYETNSRLAKSQKLAEEKRRNAELADQIRMQEIEADGKRAIRASAIRSYQRAVALGLISEEQANAARAQGMSLADLERKLNRDITGEGKIGDTSGLDRRPDPTSRPVPSILNRPPRISADDVDLAKSINPLAAPYRACPECGEIVPLTSAFCSSCGTKMTPLPQPANRNGGKLGF